MSQFGLRRFLSHRGLAWQCLQLSNKAPENLLNFQQHVFSRSIKSTPVSSLPLFSTPASMCRLTNLRSLSCPTSRLCHSQAETPDRGGGKTSDGFSMRALSQAPKPALYLGFAGLIPFVSAPALMAVTQSFCPEVAFAQMAYGASIVAFLGGARWGFAIPEGSPAPPDWMNLGNSVVPSLVAFLALLCRDNFTEGALVVIMGLGLALHYDLTLLPGYPGWFKAMRTILTLVATFSLVASLALKKLCPEKKLKELQN